MPIIFRSYFGLQQADLISALGETRTGLQKKNMAAGKINYGCFEMLSWPHRTSNNIINICFWLLETCTKCSYVIEENMRPGAHRLTFEVKFEYIAHRSTNIPWAGGLRLGKFPDNRLLMRSARVPNSAGLVLTSEWILSAKPRLSSDIGVDTECKAIFVVASLHNSSGQFCKTCVVF